MLVGGFAVENFERQDGDLIIAMEHEHLVELRKRFPPREITLLGLWSTPQRPHLHDPYYTLSDSYFQTCFAVIDNAIAAMARRIAAP